MSPDFFRMCHRTFRARIPSFYSMCVFFTIRMDGKLFSLSFFLIFKTFPKYGSRFRKNIFGKNRTANFVHRIRDNTELNVTFVI